MQRRSISSFRIKLTITHENTKLLAGATSKIVLINRRSESEASQRLPFRTKALGYLL